MRCGHWIVVEIDLSEARHKRTFCRRAPPGQRFDKIFAVNVNLFWTRAAVAEWLTVKNQLRRNGVLCLFYDTPGPGKASQVANAVTAALTGQGFSSVATYTAPHRRCSA